MLGIIITNAIRRLSNRAARNHRPSLQTRRSARARDAHRPRRTLLAPTCVLVALGVVTRAVARLAFAAAASAVIGARWIVELKMLLWRGIVRSGWIGRCALGLALDVPYRRLLWPCWRLVWVCVDVGDDGSGGFGVVGDAVVFGPGRRQVGGLFCDDRPVRRGSADVTVAFEYFLRGNVGAVVEEG